MSQAAMPIPTPSAQTNLAEIRERLSQRNDVALAERAMTEIKIGLDTAAGFDLLQRQGKMFAASSLVPQQFQGNVANCAIALNMAMRLQADPMSVMQQLYIVHGKPAWSSAFLIATFNKSGKFSSIKYRFSGTEGTDDWGCRAWATELSTGDKITGPLVTMGMAKKEGWSTKNGSKWQTMPELMLKYRAAAFLIRTTAPEIAMGIYTVEEVHDVWDKEYRPSQTIVQEPVRATIIESQPVQEEPKPEPQAPVVEEVKEEPKPKPQPKQETQKQAVPKQEAPKEEPLPPTTKTQPKAQSLMQDINVVFEDIVDSSKLTSDQIQEVLAFYMKMNKVNMNFAKEYYVNQPKKLEADYEWMKRQTETQNKEEAF